MVSAAEALLASLRALSEVGQLWGANSPLRCGCKMPAAAGEMEAQPGCGALAKPRAGRDWDGKAQRGSVGGCMKRAAGG